MAGSYLNIITFLLTTIFYYLFLNPKCTYEIISNKDFYMQYISKTYIYAVIYCTLVIIIQFILNASIISTTCGGSISQNIGASGLYTFLPWIFIFGIMIMILKVWPGFKSAFSNVAGYFYVSSQANKVISELLINKDIKDKIDKDTISTPQQKQDMENAAEAIIKICGNTSILINQIVPTNFLYYWNVLKPLMKEKYKDENSPETIQIRNNLLELVVKRDTVGEAMWYIYTGILLTSIVQLQISSKGCINDQATMEQNYQTFLDNEQAAKEKQEKMESTTYTIS
jgi:hypothetical protein